MANEVLNKRQKNKPSMSDRFRQTADILYANLDRVKAKFEIIHSVIPSFDTREGKIVQLTFNLTHLQF